MVSDRIFNSSLYETRSQNSTLAFCFFLCFAFDIHGCTSVSCLLFFWLLNRFCNALAGRIKRVICNLAVNMIEIIVPQYFVLVQHC